MSQTSTASRSKSPDGTGLIGHDPWLAPFASSLRLRYTQYRAKRKELESACGSLAEAGEAYRYFGFNRGERDGASGLWYREWAPGAEALYLTGDFNGWDRRSHAMERDEFGVWHLFLPDGGAQPAHDSRVKVHVVAHGSGMDRIPAYIRRVVYERGTNAYTGHYWEPPQAYAWRFETPELKGSPRIYEAHVGMALEAERVGTYREFADIIIPRIRSAGYNVVQLMAIQEHPYYASFGYHVSSFYAASSRFGTPYDLKYLIDTAHGAGLRVLIDLVHSHSVKNVLDGLNRFDGTDHLYFHAGPRGEHVAWDSMLFDYDKFEVLRFLLSNVRYWLEEFRFDGMRFDGITSMMYLHHGLGKDFTNYGDYFNHEIDEPAVTYLQLANALAHEVQPDVMTVAEDVSGMPGLARPVDEGGLGFDYRLAMGIPDYWIKLLKERRDEDWHMSDLYHTLINRRAAEKHVGYAESHDQALVGDKTIAFRLMDADMYWLMSKTTEKNITIERGVALHKMIRLITFALGGEGYLNFMGNEFGHPEWVDFPRAGNNDSYKYARRQWSLRDNPMLRYRDLATFDVEMQKLDAEYGLLSASPTELIQVHEDNKILVFRRGPLVFAFNWHTERSIPDLRLGVPDARDYRLKLNTDALWFGGHNRVNTGQIYNWQGVAWDHRGQSIQIYLPARTAQVMVPVGTS